MKASDLYKLVKERDDSAMGKVSYKNDHTPNNHVGGKKMKEVDPLPDTGTKRDNTGKAKVGTYKKKESRSLEGPKASPKKLKEQGLDPRIPNITMKGHAPTPTPGIRVQELDPEEIEIRGPAPTPPRKAPVRPRTKLAAQKGIEVQELEPEEIVMKGHAPTRPPAPQRRYPSAKGIGVEVIEPEEIVMKGPARRPTGSRRTVAASRGMNESGIDNEGSMSSNQTYKKHPSVSKSIGVRKQQNDEPQPTAKVGTPKKKEKRSMDANPAPVKDIKGGENEHKKMGMHEGIKELENLLQRRIRTPFLTENSLDMGALDPAVRQYLITALWAETDESTPEGGEPLDRNYDISDIDPDSIRQAAKEVEAFIQAAGPRLLRGADHEQIGHDFWLNRNGHGVGFWDRPEIYGEQQAKLLDKLAQKAGPRNIYVGDDGILYITQG